MINQADLKRSAEDAVNHVLIKMLRDIDENHTAEIINIIVKRRIFKSFHVHEEMLRMNRPARTAHRHQVKFRDI